MITAFVMINAERDHIATVPDELLRISGVTGVYSVAGDLDLVAIIRVKEADDLAKVVTEHFVKVKGIAQTKTMIAFRCYSKYDLENVFQIGVRD